MKKIIPFIMFLHVFNIHLVSQDFKQYENYNFSQWKIFFRDYKLKDELEGIWKLSTCRKYGEMDKKVVFDTDTFFNEFCSVLFIGDRFYIYTIEKDKSITNVEFQRLNCNQFVANPAWEYEQSNLSESGYIVEAESFISDLIVTQFFNAETLKYFDERSYSREYPSIFDLKNVQVQVMNFVGQGTGFFVSNDGFILTNAHVFNCILPPIKDDHNCIPYIKIPNKNPQLSQVIKARIIDVDLINDLALLKIDNNSTNIPILPIDTNEKELGDEVYVLGYPMVGIMGESIKLTEGIISSTTGYKNSINLYQISAPVNSGNSGGAVYDEFGNIIGIVNAGIDKGENIGYCIKSTIVKQFLKKNISFKPTFNSTNFINNIKSIKNSVVIIKVFETFCTNK